MNRIKVINEPTELVSVLRAMTTPLRRKVFEEISTNWCQLKEIQKKYGQSGKDAVLFFEKMKLVETKWIQDNSSNGKTCEKAYHAYYTSYHINTTCTVEDISEVLYVAMMPDDMYKKYEKKIYNLVGLSGKFSGEICERLCISPLMLKSIVKRSDGLEYRGHRIERIKG